VAYDTLPRADRTRLHERAAAGIGAEDVERHPELAEVIAFHLMQAAELEPSPERAAAAYAAAREASALAARRGAAPRAQELLARSARLAPGADERIRALSDAASIAMSRARGDQAYLLEREAGEVAEAEGDNELAAAKYGHAVEIPTRSGGISGYTNPEELREVLEHARALAPDPPPYLKAQFLLDEAWFKWRNGPELEMGEPAREALALARAGDDVRLLSSALDAVGAISHMEGRYQDFVDSCRERLEALGRVEQEGGLIYERYDAVMMLCESLMHVGDLHGAIEAETEIAPELLRISPHKAYAKTLPPLLHLGEWDRAIEHAASIRENWLDQGKPPFAPLAGDVACAGFISGARDDEPGAKDWFAFAAEIAGDNKPLSSVHLFEADLELYLGDPDRALDVLSARPPDFWSGNQMRVKRVEILCAMGDPAAFEVLADAEARATDDPLDAGLLRRARGHLEGDPARFAGACETFDRFGYAFESARTRWFLGGSDRQRALAELGRMGALPPAEPRRS
jgi:hypothetical protein